MFNGLLRHVRDGSTFHLTNRGTAKDPVLILRTATTREGHSERGYNLPYDLFEIAILDAALRSEGVRRVRRWRCHGGDGRGLRGQLALVRADLAEMKAQLAARFSKTITELVYAKEAEEVRIANELQEELVRSAKPIERAWADVSGLVEAIAMALDKNEARIKVRAAARDRRGHLGPGGRAARLARTNS